MSHKRFDHPNDVLKDMRGYSGVHLPDGVDIDTAAEELYSRLGATFPVKWDAWSTAEPRIDTNKLPSGISETDVETTLSNMKADGIL